MFCALNGATRTPRRLNHAQIAVATQLLPLFEAVPPIKRLGGIAVAHLEHVEAERHESQQVGRGRDRDARDHGVLGG